MCLRRRLNINESHRGFCDLNVVHRFTTTLMCNNNLRTFDDKSSWEQQQTFTMKMTLRSSDSSQIILHFENRLYDILYKFFVWEEGWLLFILECNNPSKYVLKHSLNTKLNLY